MGAWGAGAFENDMAADWAFEVAAAADLSPVQKAFKIVLAAGDSYLDVDDACHALAACEVVARLQGNWGQRDALSEPVDLWVVAYRQSHPETPPPDLVPDALAAMERIMRPPSELLELWQEDDPTEWLEAVAELRTRLKRKDKG